MSSRLANDYWIDLRVKVPVRVARAHFSTAVENAYEWFSWHMVEYDEDGSPISAILFYQDGNNRRQKRIFTDLDFCKGLQTYVKLHFGKPLPCVQYLGDDEWDIDADGADMIVQYAVFGELVFS